jgi:hypothetical protein
MDCLSANAAVMRAEGLSRKPGCAGAIEFSRGADPATGDFGDAKLIRKFGDVPEDLSALLDPRSSTGCNEITQLRGQLRAQEREIRMLQRAGVPTAAAELLLSRMRAKVDDLCDEREALRKSGASLSGRSWQSRKRRNEHLPISVSCINVSRRRMTMETERRETGTLIGSDKVEGTAVYGTDDQKIGSIERVMIDKVSGRVSYAVLCFEGFLGIGDDHCPLPWQSLKYDTGLGRYRTNLTAERLQGAPKYSNDNAWDWDDPGRARALNDYYSGF